MHPQQHRINRLFALAKKAPHAPADPLAATPPLGFGARVAARWAAGGRWASAADAWERLAWWGAGVAAAVCLVAAVQQHRMAEPSAFEMLLETPMETELLL